MNKLVRLALATAAFVATFAVVAHAQEHDDCIACPHSGGECSKGGGDHSVSNDAASEDDGKARGDGAQTAAAEAKVLQPGPGMEATHLGGQTSTGVEASKAENEPGAEDSLAAHESGACERHGRVHPKER